MEARPLPDGVGWKSLNGCCGLQLIMRSWPSGSLMNRRRALPWTWQSSTAGQLKRRPLLFAMNRRQISHYLRSLLDPVSHRCPPCPHPERTSPLGGRQTQIDRGLRPPLCDSAIHWRSKENLIQRYTKGVRNSESRIKRRGVFALLNCRYRLPGHADGVGQLALGHLPMLEAKSANGVLNSRTHATER